MQKITVYFSDGSSEIFHEDQTFRLYKVSPNDFEQVSYFLEAIDAVTLFKPSTKSMAIHFMSLLVDTEIFEDIETKTVYKTNSIIKVTED